MSLHVDRHSDRRRAVGQVDGEDVVHLFVLEHQSLSDSPNARHTFATPLVVGVRRNEFVNLQNSIEGHAPRADHGAVCGRAKLVACLLLVHIAADLLAGLVDDRSRF